AVRRLFNPEFLNRVDEYIIFRPLKREHISRIIDIQLQRLLKRLEVQHITLELAKSAREFLIDKGFDEKFGARPLRRALQRYLEDPLAEEILKGILKDGARVRVRLDRKLNRLAFVDTSQQASVASEEVQEEGV
ncbi:MAG: ATP-dependent Clp protease ATP-binding subunit, partial [Candidatus Kapabacteria bacterium]|nr:ATP-dependent Clp protease ATP-binding subunit [Candidatus Kapabacteria bacterium]MDW7997662.1 ATP-dependent Clp protease ATP-binding subunit [Bacteroidota bacterium]